MRHLARLVAVLGLAACGNVSHPATASDAATTPDAAAGNDAPADAQQCFATGSAQICLEAIPTAAQTITTATAINTDDPAACSATTGTAAGFCVIAATDITITGALLASGLRPLILIATSSITVTATGSIDVGSHRNPAQVGAGADPVTCLPGTRPIGTAGAAGGSFVGLGGIGGTGTSTGGGTPGAAVDRVTLPRGGCPGQDGADNGNGHASGGHGGGAVVLIAGQKIAVAGIINAAGEGGGRGPAQKVSPPGSPGGAGAGGGAGGMIGLDAPIVSVEGVLLANGGGGGGGGNLGVGLITQDPSAPKAAPGGGGDTDHGAGSGGLGSAPTSVTAPGTAGRGVDTSKTTPTDPAPGAGGGGGGAGIILAPASAQLGTQLSPPFTPLS